MKGFLWVIMLVSVVGGTSAQVPSSGSELRENIHLHLNKTTFFQGESIWFTAYVQDQNAKTLSKTTRNLHVALSDSEGKTVAKKTIYVENGIGIGDFELDTTFTDTDYALTAWTNYMRNFTDLKPFRQQITLLRENQGQFNGTAVTTAKIEIYPEGTSLIGGVYNQVAFRLTDATGRGISQDYMYLTNSSGTVITSSIATDDEGFGRIGLLIDPQEQYMLWFTDEGEFNTRQEFPLPTIMELGVQVDNGMGDLIMVRLIGTERLIAEKNGEQYTIAIFQDDQLLLQDVHVGTDELSIALDGAALSYGANTLVVLNADLEPIAHRLFFNPKRDAGRIASPLRTSHSLEGDSLRLQLELSGDLDMEAILSVSALPGTTLAYNPNHDILGSFVLNPYLKDNAALGLRYLGQDWDRQDWFRLDTRLIAEGNGNYSWDSRVLTDVQQQYAMESGFLVKGSITDTDITEEQEVYLTTKRTRQLLVEGLKADKTFAAKMNLTEGDSLLVSLLDPDGKPRKAKISIVMEEKKMDIPAPYLEDDGPVYGNDSQNNTYKPLFNTLNEGVIRLDEVILESKVREQKKVYLNAVMEANFIDDKDIKLTPTVRSYIMKYGIEPIFTSTGELLLRKRGSPGHTRPFFSVALNGLGVMPSEVMDIPMSTVSIIYMQTDVNFGLFIGIEQRNGDYISPEERNKYVRYLIENGYSESSAYRTPVYISYESDDFKNYGVLDWQPNVRINGKEQTVFKIPTRGQEGIRLFIEGICADGSLISVEKEINLKDKR